MEHFYKVQGCGNSFIIIHSIKDPKLEHSIEYISKFAKLLCSTGYGLGTDGLMYIRSNQGEKKGKDFDFYVDMFNPDGSWMGMCGNGIRCVVRTLFISEQLSKNTSKYLIGDKLFVCNTEDEGKNVTVNMGLPSFLAKDVGLSEKFNQKELFSSKIAIMDGQLDFIASAVSIPNPHVVIIDKQNISNLKLPLSQNQLSKYGYELENHCYLKNKANIEFVEIVSRDLINVQVWERAAGITLACGTGACASFVVAKRAGFINDQCNVKLPGGILKIEENSNGMILMTGEAKEILKGTFLNNEFLNFINSL